MAIDDERRLVEHELRQLREEEARTDQRRWRGLWIGTVVVFALLAWLLFWP